ncbi:MAG: adenine deaminase C-terminal domain-containing protein, partial [Bacteroidota bacterium]
LPKSATLARLGGDEFSYVVPFTPGQADRVDNQVASLIECMSYPFMVDGVSINVTMSIGISTDHEAFSYEEALEKLQNGMKILIREGSAAKNFEALIDLLPEYFENMMFCSDDKHPDDLLLGHINQLVQRAIAKGMDLYKVLRVACINPIEHYRLEVGQLREGDPADFILVKDLTSFEVLQTYINGQLVSENGKSLIKSEPFNILNNFNTSLKQSDDFKLKAESDNIKVIECLDGELITNQIVTKTKVEDGYMVSDVDKDILKITVVNRYKDEIPTVAFIKNLGLKEGAIASSVAHDSHNIVAVGVDDESICKAVNAIINEKGGICAISENKLKVMPLPVAGIMSDKDAVTTGKDYSELDAMAKAMGSQLSAPFMTLSFMALLVIPSLKLSDLGLFDGNNFQFTALQQS